MADENNLPEELSSDMYLPYDTEFLNSACSAYATLIEIDPQLLSKSEQSKLSTAKDKLLKIIVASSNKIYEDYFGT